MARSPSALGEHLGYWMRFVSNHVSHAFAVRLEALGITVVEWVVLRMLYDRDMAPSVLADDLRMTRGAISKLAERLDARGLVRRVTGDGDRRYQTLSLTRKARVLVPRLAAVADDNDADFFGHLTTAEREQLEATLHEIVRRRQLTKIPTE